MDSIIKKHKAQKQKKNYFTQQTEDAIIAYNKTLSPNEKSKIYELYIHYPFYKLTQNIIHTFKFYNTDVENLEDLQHEIMVFLLSKIHLFNPEVGAKAYSYFGTIVKRWLIIYDKNNYKEKLKKLSIDNLNFYSELDTTNPLFINNSKVEADIDKLKRDNIHYDDNDVDSLGYKEKDKLSLFMDRYLDYCTKNIYTLFPKESDAQIADAILELFRKREYIEIFNKKALYLDIREIIDVKTPKITKISDQLKYIFKKNYQFYIDTGEFPF